MAVIKHDQILLRHRLGRTYSEYMMTIPRKHVHIRTGPDTQQTRQRNTSGHIVLHSGIAQKRDWHRRARIKTQMSNESRIIVIVPGVAERERCKGRADDVVQQTAAEATSKSISCFSPARRGGQTGAATCRGRMVIS